VERLNCRPILSTENDVTKPLSNEEATKEDAAKNVGREESITEVCIAVH
jgi:hypothetical protein